MDTSELVGIPLLLEGTLEQAGFFFSENFFTLVFVNLGRFAAVWHGEESEQRC